MLAPLLIRRAALGALLAALLSIPLVPRARAQAPPSVSLALVGQPVWHGPENPLALRLRVTNDGLSTLGGFDLQVRTYSRAASRSELHQNFDVDPLRIESSSLRVERPGLDVAPGTSTEVNIDAPVSDLTSLIGGLPGVYPITITLTDVDGFTALDSVTTQLLYFPEEVEVPLNVVVLWPLVDIPSRRAGGLFVPAEVNERSALEIATAPDGWLTGILDALEAPYADDVRLGVAPGPRLIEEISDMADGFRHAGEGSVRSVTATNPSAQAARATLERLQRLARDPGVQTMHMPYAFPDLTAIDDFERLSAQLSAAQTELEETLSVPPDDGWLFPPAGRLDQVTLERLRSSDAAASTFFSADSLEPESIDLATTCRQDFVGITYTCPIKVETATGRSRGFVLDGELQQRFGALVSAPSEVVEMQKLFAETAQIWAELQGTSDRVIALAVPPLWHPERSLSERFVRTLAQGPWVRTRTPRSGLHLGIGTIDRELVTVGPPARAKPEPAYLDAIDEAAGVIESFARVQPPVELVQRLRRDVLIGQSLLWWGDDPVRLSIGADFSAEAKAEATAEMAKISIAGRHDITLASRNGTLPLSLQNSTDYPVTLEVHLESTDRDLDLSDRTVTQTFEPGATPLVVQVSARSSGIYPVRIRVTASDGYEVFETSISIRSTEFNEIALAITLGALIFLVAFSTVRSIRRRRSGADTGETP